jgi:hypothetical protein
MLVERLGRRLSAEQYPRLTILAALTVSGGCAATFSALGLHAGLLSMPLRYGLSVLVGYAVFLGCIRIWIGYERRKLDRRAASLRSDSPGSALDLVDLVPDVDLAPGRVAARGAANLFGGGTSGGAGGGAEWAAVMPPMPADAVPDTNSGSAVGAGAHHVVGSLGDMLDGDDVAWLLVAIGAALGGLLAICWIVYVAPVLLAEVALDAAVVSTAYRRLRGQDIESWMTAVFRRTWIPASVLAVMMTLAGYALHRVAPAAHSIGGVLRHLVG